MKKKLLFRLFTMLIIFILTCELGFRIRLAFLYKKIDWFFYHQFRFRTAEQIAKEDLPHYYKDNMFKPFSLIYKKETPASKKTVITIESSTLRSIRRQLEKMLLNYPNLEWQEREVVDSKTFEFSNNDIVLYDFLVYPDIHNTLKRESRILKKILGATLDDFLYHNLVFYMHIDENVNFTFLHSDELLNKYIRSLFSREEPFCQQIHKLNAKNVIYVITPNCFDSNSSGGAIYLKYVDAAYKAIIPLLEKYNVTYIDLMNEETQSDDFTDFFHFSPEGGKKMSEKIINFLKEEGY